MATIIIHVTAGVITGIVGTTASARGSMPMPRHVLEHPRPNSVFIFLIQSHAKPGSGTTTLKIEFDRHCRPQQVTVKNLFLPTPAMMSKELKTLLRNSNASTKVGHIAQKYRDSGSYPWLREAYDGGHFLGCRFLGPSFPVCMTPQHRRQNRVGDYKKFENDLAQLIVLSAGQRGRISDVGFTLWSHYPDSQCPVARSFTITVHSENLAAQLLLGDDDLAKATDTTTDTAHACVLPTSPPSHVHSSSAGLDLIRKYIHQEVVIDNC